MAVPKKKRTNSRVLNRGGASRTLSLRVLNLSISGVATSYLRRLLKSPSSTLPKAYFLYPAPHATPAKRGLTPPTFTPFYKEEALFSTKALFGLPYRARPCKGLVPSLLFQKSSTTRVSTPLLLGPRGGSSKWESSLLWSPLRVASPMFVKRFFFSMQLPHKWGGQRGLFFKNWELSPSYHTLAPLGSSCPSWGYLTVNYPSNLERPKGPTLRELHLYIKTNPNEGYWMYCMWLRVVKKWKRWARFPFQYFIKRNYLRRIWIRRSLNQNLYQHKLVLIKSGRRGLLPFIRSNLDLAQRTKAAKAAFSPITFFALKVAGLNFIGTKVKDPRTQVLKAKALKGRAKPQNWGGAFLAVKKYLVGILRVKLWL